MPDNLTLLAAANAVREQAIDDLVVLPAQRLTGDQRDQVRHAMRSLRLAADRLEESLDTNRPADALAALDLAQAAGHVSGGTAARLRGRR